MSDKILIKNAKVVNEGRVIETDVLVVGQRIEKIGHISDTGAYEVFDAKGLYLTPGMIDDQVHFREPGFETKGEIKTESAAAVAGGITSYMEMPNTKITTTTKENLADKFSRAALKSLANFSFYFGATNDNLEDIKKLSPLETCGVKVFMGSSTGNMLVDKEEVLAGIFKECPVLVATHCEDTPMITQNEEIYRAKYGEDVSSKFHALIRSEEACYKSSSMAVNLAKKYGTKLHVLHLTTEKELSLFEAGAIENKRITAEVCLHHLLLNENDYESKGNLIKCNPSIKKMTDQKALQKAFIENKLDILATDHAPHTWEEKQRPYFKAPSGLPLVQHAVIGALELVHEGLISIEDLVKKFAHNVAIRFEVKERGFIREGYFADLVLIDTTTPTLVEKQNLLYKCNWSPFEGDTFKSSIARTMVNGSWVYQNGKILDGKKGLALQFNR